MTYKGKQAMAQIVQAIKNGVKRAEYRSTVNARRYAEGISKGPFKTEDLVAMDHPYAARHGAILGSVHPFWINEQTGRLEQSWHVVNMNTIRNDAPYASFLYKGTHFKDGRLKMFGRDYVGAIKAEWVRLRENEIMREMALIGIPCRKT